MVPQNWVFGEPESDNVGMDFRAGTYGLGSGALCQELRVENGGGSQQRSGLWVSAVKSSRGLDKFSRKWKMG